MNNVHKCRIIDGTKSLEEYMKGREVDFSGFIGFCDENEYNAVSEYGNIYVKFDEVSVKRLPKKYLKDGDILGYDPTAYVFVKREVELI